MQQLSLEYGILVFLAVIGVLQLAAIHSRWSKLVFFQNKVLEYVLALVLLLVPLVFLFSWNYRAATGIVQGAEQAWLFILSMALAVLFTLIFSSLINHSGLDKRSELKEGLEALKELTYFQALWRRFGRKS